MALAALYPLGLRLDDWSLFDHALSPAAGMALLLGGGGPLFSASGVRATLVVGGAGLPEALPDPSAPGQGPLIIDAGEQEVAFAVTLPAWLLGEAGGAHALSLEIAALFAAGGRTADVAPTLCAGLGAADATTVIVVLGTTLAQGTPGTLYYPTLHVTSTAGTVARVRLAPFRCPPASSWATTP